MAPSQDRTRCVHGGPSHRNVPVWGQALRLPGAGLEVGTQGPCGFPLACPMPTSPRLAPRPAHSWRALNAGTIRCRPRMGQGPGLPLALTSCPLHTRRADSPVMPSLERVPSSPEPRNLSLCLVKGTLELLWTMGPGQLIKGEGASYRESAADPLLGTHLGTSYGQSTLTIQGLWC